MKSRLRVAGWLLCVLWSTCATLHAQGVRQSPRPGTAEPEFVYRFRARDTLIQVSRRLLLQPQRWSEVQSRNRIRDPFNIPPDTPIRIPYSWLRLTSDTAIVQAVAGTVTRDGAAVSQGDVLPEGARIETGADGSISIQFADLSVVTLQKSSVMLLARLKNVQGASGGHEASLELESGRAETQVKPKRDVGRFEIVTPVAISAVRGTRFRTGFDASSAHATTETLEGTVGVGSQIDSVSLAAGFGTRVESTGTVLAPVPLLPMPDLQSVPAVNARAQLHVEFPPLQGAANYRVQLAADAEFRALLTDKLVDTPVLALDMPADGEYWLRVRGVDGLGIEGADAARRVTQHLLPSAPEPQSPANGSRQYSGSTRVQWAPLADAVGYRLQLARDSLFTDLVSERVVDNAAAAELAGLSPGEYHWRIAGVNARGEAGPWSQARQFVQSSPPPAAEVVRADRKLLHLKWPATEGESFRLQVARDAAFTHVIVDMTPGAAEYRLEKPAAGNYYVRLQRPAIGGAPEPFGEVSRAEIPIPRWLKILLGSTVVLPVLL